MLPRLHTKQKFLQGESWSTRPSSFAAPHLPSANTHEVIGDEATLVREMCTSGGLRPQPSADQLRRFVEKVAVLDPYVTAVEITEQLAGEGSWQSKIRALCALCAVAEAAGAAGAAQGVTTLASVFGDNPESVRALCQHSQVRLPSFVLRIALGHRRFEPLQCSCLCGSRHVYLEILSIATAHLGETQPCCLAAWCSVLRRTWALYDHVPSVIMSRP
jgi:hypothetical protein